MDVTLAVPLARFATRSLANVFAATVFKDDLAMSLCNSTTSQRCTSTSTKSRMVTHLHARQSVSATIRATSRATLGEATPSSLRSKYVRPLTKRRLECTVNVLCFNFQNEVLQDVSIDRPSYYRMVLRYVNPSDETVMAKVRMVPENPNDAEQTYLVRMEPSKEPKSVTVAGPSGNLPTPFILNTGTWTISIATNTSLLLDYFALLPAAYYEGTILQERVLKPCLFGEQQQGSCRQFTYASLNHYESAGADTALALSGDDSKPAEIVQDSRVSLQTSVIHFGRFDAFFTLSIHYAASERWSGSE